MTTDGLGSAEVALDGSGTAQASVLYDPYGNVRYSSGSMPGSYGYTGQRADAATGLDYYNARYYDAVAGQFTSADSLAAGGLNRYAYVAGNPETATDPTGHLHTCMDGCGGGGGSGTPPTPPPPSGGTPPSGCKTNCGSTPPGGCHSGCNGKQLPVTAPVTTPLSALSDSNTQAIMGDVANIVIGLGMIAGAIYLMYQLWPAIQGTIAATGPMIDPLLSVFGFAVRNPLVAPFAAFDGLLIILLGGLSLVLHSLDDILVRTGNADSGFAAIVDDLAAGVDVALTVAVGVEALLVGDAAFSIGGLVGAVATGLTAFVAWQGFKALWQGIVSDFQQIQSAS